MIMKILILVLLTLCSVVFSFYLGFIKARKVSAFEEAKILNVFILEHGKLLPENNPFGQYVLARYYLSLSRLDQQTRKSLFTDFGPLKPDVLSRLSVDKNPVDLYELYPDLKK